MYLLINNVYYYICKFKFKLIIIYLLINNIYYIIFLIFYRKEQEYITYILRVKRRKFHFRVKNHEGEILNICKTYQSTNRSGFS